MRDPDQTFHDFVEQRILRSTKVLTRLKNVQRVGRDNLFSSYETATVYLLGPYLWQIFAGGENIRTAYLPSACLLHVACGQKGIMD